MKSKQFSNKLETTEEIQNEIEELETDQHPIFFKNEHGGRKRMSDLLKKLNVIKNALRNSEK